MEPYIRHDINRTASIFFVSSISLYQNTSAIFPADGRAEYILPPHRFPSVHLFFHCMYQGRPHSLYCRTEDTAPDLRYESAPGQEWGDPEESAF